MIYIMMSYFICLGCYSSHASPKSFLADVSTPLLTPLDISLSDIPLFDKSSSNPSLLTLTPSHSLFSVQPHITSGSKPSALSNKRKKASLGQQFKKKLRTSLWRIGFNYSQINIPKIVNNLGSGFAYPIYSKKTFDIGLKVSIGHSLDRNLFTTLQPTFYYIPNRWIELGLGLDYTLIPGADQDIAAVYLWSLGMMGRFTITIPASVLIIRPYIGIQASYSHTAWERKTTGCQPPTNTSYSASSNNSYQSSYQNTPANYSSHPMCTAKVKANTEIDWILKVEPVIGIRKVF